MAVSTKAMGAPILLMINLAMYLIVLGIGGWALNTILDEGSKSLGNQGRYTLVVLSMVASVVGVASLVVELADLRSWPSGPSSSSLLALLLALLASGVACKEIHRGEVDRRMKAMESFVIILAITQLLYVIMITLQTGWLGHGHRKEHMLSASNYRDAEEIPTKGEGAV